MYLEIFVILNISVPYWITSITPAFITLNALGIFSNRYFKIIIVNFWCYLQDSLAHFLLEGNIQIFVGIDTCNLYMGSKRGRARFSFHLKSIDQFIYLFGEDMKREDKQSGICLSFWHEGPFASNKKRSFGVQNTLWEHCTAQLKVF